MKQKDSGGVEMDKWMDVCMNRRMHICIGAKMNGLPVELEGLQIQAYSSAGRVYLRKRYWVG